MAVAPCERCGIAVGTRTYAARQVVLLLDGRIAAGRRLCAPCAAHVEQAVAIALERPPARLRVL